MDIFHLSPTKEDLNEENCFSRISEANIAHISILNNSKQNEDDRPMSPSYHSDSKKTKEDLDNSQDENALGLIMSMISETCSEENKNLPKIKRKISRISMTSSIDCKLYI